MVGRPSRRSGTGRKTHLEVRKWSETLPEVWNWSGDPHGGLELVGRHSRKFEIGWETLPSCGTGRETLPEFQKW